MKFLHFSFGGPPTIEKLINWGLVICEGGDMLDMRWAHSRQQMRGPKSDGNQWEGKVCGWQAHDAHDGGRGNLEEPTIQVYLNMVYTFLAMVSQLLHFSWILRQIHFNILTNIQNPNIHNALLGETNRTGLIYINSPLFMSVGLCGYCWDNLN